MTTDRNFRARTLICLLAMLMLASLASAGGALAAPATDPVPSVSSDKADYAPGELVTLSGAHWGAGETVHIRVNDDAGSSWSRDVDVTADDAGVIADSFNLPEWFVAQYSVLATGASGSVATSSFTDGNVRVKSANGRHFEVTATLYPGSANCGGAPDAPDTSTADANGATWGVGNNQSLLVAANPNANAPNASATFDRWTLGTVQLASGYTVTDRIICIVGFQSGSRDLVGNYLANAAPTVATNNASVTVDEGQTAANTGTYSDANGDSVTISASRGTVTKTGTNSGTWSWSFASTDGPDQTGLVTITASDGKTGGTTTTTFTLNVNNVAPTVTLVAANPLSVNEGSAQQSYSFTIADPGTDTVTSVTTGCGANGAKVVGSDTNTNTAGSFECTFPDGPNSSVVSASATDSDAATGNLATQTVTVANVAPTVTLTGAATADEGQTRTYAFTVTDPGMDAFTVDGGFPDCDAGATNNGSYVTGSLVVTAAGGSFDCFFADGPATANVKIKVSDSDGASGTDSESVQVVAVTNVAPTVTAPANQAADEGASTSLNLGSFTDPGPDAPWAVDVNWGDGSTHTTFDTTDTGSLGTRDHTYADDGDYTVSVKVTDRNGDSDTKTFTVSVANVAPTTTLTAGNDLSVSEGPAEHSYSYEISDPGADTVASVATSCGGNGTKVAGSDTNTNSAGSFKCVFPDGPASSTVSASATDSDNDTGTADTQSVQVTNVAPTTTLAAGNDLAVNEGTTHTYGYTITDPGTDTVTSVTTGCGANGAKVAGSDTNTNTAGSFKCTFPDGPNSSVISASATDSDSATGNLATQTVTVNNIAPTVTLTGAATADEGDTRTYAFTVTDPGADAFAVDGGFPDCDAGATNNGSYVTGTLALTAAGGSFKCSFPDGPATANVKIKVSDSDGASDTASESVTITTVANVAPSVTAAADQAADEGTLVNVSLGSFTDPGSDSWSVDVAWGDDSDDSTFAASTGTLAAKAHTYDDNGAYTVTVRVSDEDGGTDSKTFQVTVSNLAPTANLGNNGPIVEGSAATISFTDQADASDADTAAGFRYAYHCDGSAFASAPTYADSGASDSKACEFADNGTHTVRARIIDKDGGFNEYTTTVTVTNAAPVLSAAEDQGSDEGQSKSFELGSFADAGANDSPWNVDVDWGDGSTPTSFETSSRGDLDPKTHTYADSGSYTVSVNVTDNNGASDTRTFTVTVANVAPTTTLAAGNDLSVSEGSAEHSYSYTISDPGADTVSSVATSCGDNGAKVAGSDTNTNTTGSFKCTFADGPASSTVSASATDSDNETGTPDTQTVTVANEAPTATLTGPATADEGDTKTYTFTVTDPGSDTFTVDGGFPDCDAGATNHGSYVAGSLTTTAAGGTFKCSFPDGPATANVKIKVTDSDGASDTASESVQIVAVANVAPTVTPAADQTADEGAAKTVTLGSFTDPGPDSPWAVDVNWGDGSTHTTFNATSTGSLGSRHHTYADDGTYTVSIKVTDNNGASDTKTFTVTVANVAPTTTLDADNDLSVNEGSAEHSYSYTITDPGTDTVTSVATDCGANGTKVAGSDTNTNTGGSFKCTFADGPASSTVSASATDSDNDTGTPDTQTVTVANIAPTTTLAAGNDLSVNEGSTHTYSYTITDPGQDTVSAVTTSCGANGTKSDATNTNTAGSFKCTFPDGPDSSVVSASATDSDSATGNLDTQTVQVANVAPTTTLSANDLAVDEGTTHTYSYTITDPGQDSVSAVTTSCGANGTKSDANNTNTAGSFKCTFPDGPDSSVVSASATDSDSATGNLDTQTVQVANVAPTVNVTGAGDVLEGSTHTYTFTVTDPGVDGFDASASFPDCDAGATDNGTLVAGSYSATASGGTFKCFFADGPATANVKIKVADSDGASGTDSESVTVVNVANVAPSVTAPANQAADEGASKAFNLGSFTDPGPDSPWAVDVNWGDGSAHAGFDMTLTGTLGTQDHTYADSGSYTVSVKVTDNNNASDTKTFTVTVANVAPTTTLAAGNDLSVNEGSAEHGYSYTIADPGDDTVTSVTTGCGANGAKVTGSDTNTNTSGSFKCTFADGPNSSVVSASATDSDSLTGNTASQTVQIANVAPTTTLASANDLSANEGSTHTYAYTISDPGTDSVTSVATSCGANGAKVAGSDTNTNTSGSFECTFADGPASSTVSAAAKDSDGDTGNTASQTVTVANVAPTVNVTGAGDVLEGSTHTYTFTVTDPGVDDFVVSAGYPDCDAGLTNNGTLVAGSLAVTAAGGSFDCFFADGPASADVKIKVADSDGASGTASESVQVVAVANVAPSVTAPANQAADEGAAKTINLGSFTDPGPDSPWTVDVSWGDGSAHAGFDMTLTGTLGTQDHTYADSGSYTVSVKVTDSNGASDTETFTIKVANVAPTTTLATGNDLSVNEGAAEHSYSYTIADPGDDTVTSVTTGCGANGAKVTGSDTNTNTSGSFKCTFADGPNSSVVSASATDSDSLTGNTASQTVQIANVAPTVSVTGPATADEGDTKTYTFTVTDPGTDTFTVDSGYPDCDAGATNNGDYVTGSIAVTAGGGSFQCFFADGPASASVKMKVSDSDLASDTDLELVQIVAVTNVAPSVTAPANQTADEGASKTVNLGSFTDPGPDSPWTVDVNWGDGSTHTTFNSTSTGSLGSRDHTYADDGSYTVSVKVTDNNNASDTKTFTVTVANVAPSTTLAAGNDLSVNEGATEHSYSYTISDPGADTVSSVATSCGDNGTKVAGSDTNTNTTGSFKCTFADGPNSSTVTASATDSDSLTGNTAGQTVQVTNVAPAVSVTGPATADEGDTKTYTFTVTDPGTDAFTVDSGYPDCDSAATNNGSYVTGSIAVTEGGGSFQCFFADGPASASVKMKVSDSDGASDTDLELVQIVAVANVAPSVTAAANQAADEGASKTFNLGSFTDPGPDSPWAVDVDWGDGSTHTTFDATSTGSLGSRAHTYADGPATRPVTVKVTDKNGGTDSKTFTVTVANVAPTTTLAAGNDLSVNEGSTQHSYSYTITDPGTDTVTSVATSCGANGTKVAGSDTNTDTAGSFKCTFADGPNSSVVSASATDSDNATGNLDTQTVTVANVAPTVNVTGASQADEGSTHTYTFTVTDPGVDGFDASAGYPDCDAAITNNGTVVAGSYSPTAAGGTFKCFFADGPATANVKMKVADSDGDSGMDSESVQVVEVANVAPSVTAAANQDADEGASKAFNLGSFTDPGPDSPWAVDVDWGDGSTHTTFDATSTGSLGSRDHTYADGPATRTVTVKVTDKNGGTDSKTFTVIVANVAPTADLGNDGPKAEGSPVTVSFTNPADPSSGDVTAGFRHGFACTTATALPTTYAAAGTAASKDCTFFDNGTYVVKGRIFDRNDGYRTYDTSVTVTNVAPTITSFTGTNSLAGPLAFAPSTFTTDFTDPGTLDKWSAGFTWSSGLPTSQTVAPFVTGQTVTHTFAAGCNRTATVAVTDDDGGSDTKSTSVNVGTGTWLPPLADQPVSDKLRNGQVLPVKIKITDCNGVAVTGLAPVIQLVKGDQTTVNDDGTHAITITSVSAADSGTTMRESGGTYMYNLRVNVPSADLNKDYTIIIYPYGTGTPQTLRHVIQATK